MKRGPYKRFLEDENILIPRTTRRPRRLNENIDENEEHRHVDVGIGAGDNEPTNDENQIIIGRGKYKLYVEDSNIPVPQRTQYRRSQIYQNIEENIEDHEICNARVDDENDNDIVDNVNQDDQVDYVIIPQDAQENTSENDEDDNSDWSNNEHIENENRIVDNEDNEEILNSHPVGPQERVPLYNDCNLTQEESELLIMGFAVRHGLSDYALDDLLKLINCHLPRTQYISKYLFLKKFSPAVKTIFHFYCPQCKNSLQFADGRLIDRCEDCNNDFKKDDLKKAGNFFLHIPLADQLRGIMNSNLYYKLSKNRFNESDVVNGRVYRKLVNREVIGEHDITLQLNTDGVAFFNSSKMSMWPIQVVINELPYRLRRQNVMLCGLWYGTDKPVIDLFMKPFVDELIILHNEGMKCITPEHPETINIKVHTLIASVDSVARPLLQNLKQFNGESGCSFCLKKGDRIPFGRRYTRVYCGDIGVPRTTLQHEADCEEAIETNACVRGVKGPSILMKLPVFNIINSFVPDYMHTVLLGVTKTFVCNIWFDPANKDKEWYIGNKMIEFDKNLCNIKPPCEITRVPRSITERQLWKASEWRNFLLYYSSACLFNLMHRTYIKHWSLLVFSMHIFLKDKITENEFYVGERSLKKFVFQTETLYGQEFMKFNVHLLLHIPKSVSAFGSLWAHSAYPFEHYNGRLKKLYHNTQAVPRQICKTYFRLKTVDRISNKIFKDENCTVRGKLLFNKMFGPHKINSCVEYGPHLRLLQPSSNISLNIVQQACIIQLLQEELVSADNIQLYKRFIFKNILYHSVDYERFTKRENSVIQLTNGAYIMIQNICMVQKINCNEDIYVIFGLKLLPLNLELAKDSQVNNTSTLYSSIVRKSDEIICILPTSIKRKCIKMNYNMRDDHYIVMPLVNLMEID
ncbi:uncharacterized protein LOC120357714 [Solenopsis invicta]|uniref:uncharacterized protein LOC120357714 n=1 Tax=Solenopsis invicta TaxID=13686 RepID=UPI00193D65DB|nr:uncharacterized protein LOC120357714 [Solenopsis invicta]